MKELKTKNVVSKKKRFRQESAGAVFRKEESLQWETVVWKRWIISWELKSD